MDSFRSPMVSKYKVQKAGEKKKKDSASRWEQASKVHLPATYSNSRRTNFNASNIIRLNATAGSWAQALLYMKREEGKRMP